MAAAVFDGSSIGLAYGLSKLREEGLFCDVFFAAGGVQNASQHRWVGAHQVVLAAGNTGFRTRLSCDAISDLDSPPEPLEVQLHGISRFEAVEDAVTSAYGLGNNVRSPSACRHDAQLLADGLQLCEERIEGTGEVLTAMASEMQSMRKRGHLCDLILRVGDAKFHAHQVILAAASTGFKQYMTEHRCQLLPKVVPPHGVGLFKQLSALPNVKTTQPLELELQGISHEEAVLAMLDYAYGEERSTAFLPTARESLKDLVVLAGALDLPKLRDAAAARLCEGDEPQPSYEHALLQVARFDDDREKLPDMLPDMPKLMTRESKVLEKLFDAFEERPLWLELPLSARLPASVTVGSDILKRLLPYVCYRWKDGPWKNTYCRLGFDPREEEADSKWLQVINFRDPHFKPVHAKAEAANPVPDHTFRRPPSEKVQQYQLLDIRDDFVHTLVKGAEGVEAVDKKYGWLPQVMFEAVNYRLQLKSLHLRDKKASGAATAGPSRGRRSSLATSEGPRAKGARIGGA